jgi:hypothetical protein
MRSSPAEHDFIVGTFLSRTRARMIDQNSAHRLRCEPKEMGAVLPTDAFPAEQAHVELVDQGGWLQGMVGTLTLELARGDPAELIDHQRHQTVERCRVAIGPVGKQSGNARLTHGRSLSHCRLEV